MMALPAYILEYIPEDIKIEPVSELVFEVTRIDQAEKDIQVRTEKKKLLLVCGMSGAGKTSICNEITKANPKFKKVKSSTTRPRRQEEDADNDPYYRLSFEEFEKSVAAGEVIEHTKYADHYYFTRKDSLSSILDEGKFPMMVVDPNGANFYTKKWNEGDEFFAELDLVRLFVVPPSMEVLKKRLVDRSDEPSLVERRLLQSLDDLQHVFETDYIVINETNRLEEVTMDVLRLLDSK